MNERDRGTRLPGRFQPEKRSVDHGLIVFDRGISRRNSQERGMEDGSRLYRPQNFDEVGDARLVDNAAGQARRLPIEHGVVEPSRIHRGPVAGGRKGMHAPNSVPLDEGVEEFLPGPRAMAGDDESLGHVSSLKMTD